MLDLAVHQQLVVRDLHSYRLCSGSLLHLLGLMQEVLTLVPLSDGVLRRYKR